MICVPNGNKEWDASFGGSGEEELSSLMVAQDGGYLLGGTSGAIPFPERKSQWSRIPFLPDSEFILY